MIRFENDGEEKAKVYIYGTIGDHWKDSKANRAKDFALKLDELSPKALEIHVDSPGGDVFEGFAIASAIQRYAGETHVYVDGVAASAASYIAIMADKVTMNDFAAFMIHNASGIVIGNRDDMRETADLLERLDNSIAVAISGRTGMGIEDVKAAMSAETWYFGDEAKEAGFCDEVVKTEKRAKATLERKYADNFKHVPEGIEIVDGQQPGEAADPKQRYMISVTDTGITFFPVQDDGAQPDAGEMAAGTIPAACTSEPTQEPTQEPAPQDLGEGASHAETNLAQSEGRDAKGAILLGNRIYRKEN